MVGVALAEPRQWNETLWVWEFHVAETRRGRGIGRRLMAELAEQARAAGLRALVCETQNTNLPAINFYRAVGFTLEGVDVSYYTNDDMSPGGTVAVFMKLRIK
jgi:ribosomal protein S18 acetylase RimI-like enzyme